ncbi:MAG: hypothetical protein KDD35_02165 [Bdellovibrionales bacterium]|nr:hypothetical protein [Bdellovibrionales bacterium]
MFVGVGFKKLVLGFSFLVLSCVYSLAQPGKRELQVKYFAHNHPSLQEFLRGRSRVSEILSLVLDSEFELRASQLEVGIAPLKMAGGAVVLSKGVLYVWFDATDEQIESGLLYSFKLEKQSGDIRFFGHNGPTISQFYLVKERVERVLSAFSRYGLRLKLPTLEIGISPIEMLGGNVVFVEGKLFISISASEEDIERIFTPYILVRT